MDDLLVVGLDLCSLRMVEVGDAPKAFWDAKSYTGDRTLVCFHCYSGDDMPAGSRVPLKCRGKLNAKVRTHFAHPEGMGPPGGHGPETAWHANGKLRLLRWAEALPNVRAVRVELPTPDRRRRSDIAVTLIDGTPLALEIQQQPSTDRAWQARHDDYTAAKITDVWLWHPRIGVPGIALGQAQCHWQLSAELTHIAFPVAAAHPRRPTDSNDGLAEHYPPCSGDKVTNTWKPLADFSSTAPVCCCPPRSNQNLTADAQTDSGHRPATGSPPPSR